MVKVKMLRNFLLVIKQNQTLQTSLQSSSEAPSHGKPINYYDRVSRGAEAYSNLANEFLKQNK